METGLKLHLGCGKKRLPGFIHLDARSEVNPDIVTDVLNLNMFPDNSVDMIYFCHGLEHISPYQVPVALAEWKRVLRIGGILRLSMPDFAVLARMYVLEQIPLDSIVSVIHGKQEYRENTHYWSWDFSSLSRVLVDAGFAKIRTYDPVVVNPPGYKDSSVFQVAERLISLNIEALKPELKTDINSDTL